MGWIINLIVFVEVLSIFRIKFKILLVIVLIIIVLIIVMMFC